MEPVWARLPLRRVTTLWINTMDSIKSLLRPKTLTAEEEAAKAKKAEAKAIKKAEKAAKLELTKKFVQDSLGEKGFL